MDDVKVKGIFNRISALMPEFTNSEKKVASFILSEKQNVTNMTILDIAQGASVSEASVMRFCNRLGIRKLIDLRIEIAKDSDERKKSSANPIEALDNDYIDTLAIARKFLPDLKSKKLGSIATYFKFNTDGMHRGLKDCVVTNMCYQKFLQMHKESQLQQVNALGLTF